MTSGRANGDFLTLITRASRAVKAHVERAFEGRGVHAGQQFILQKLWDEDGLTPGELAERIGVETPTVTKAAQRMERAGLVRRDPDPSDGRLVRVFLTSAGAALRSDMPAILAQATEEALAGLSDEERVRLLGSLARVARNLSDDLS